MSSGFVSGGTAGEEADRNDEWKNAQRQIEEARRVKEELARQHDGKSLFEVLQANKEKKQAEFEQRARFQLHNALDDDEANFLESVLEKSKREETRIKKETLEQLDLFKSQQEEIKRQDLEMESLEPSGEDQGVWATKSRKRKKAPDAGLLRGVKLRKSSSAASQPTVVDEPKAKEEIAQQITSQVTSPRQLSTSKSSSGSSYEKPRNGVSLELGYASSDEED